MYTIGQVSEMFHIPVSTLRYYDKEGLFPNLERKGNIRKFSDAELDQLHMIECLKKSGVGNQRDQAVLQVDNRRQFHLRKAKRTV